MKGECAKKFFFYHYIRTVLKDTFVDSSYFRLRKGKKCFEKERV